MKLHFTTPAELSYIDLVSMGDSEKRGDDTKIGQFGSGLKYAIALLLRNGVKFHVETWGVHYIGGHDRQVRVHYWPFIYTEEDPLTGKSRELIGFNVEREYESFHSYIQTDEFTDGVPEETIKTGFSPELGYNWELWMAFRELVSNMIDEGGSMGEERPEKESRRGTCMVLEFDEDSPFHEVYMNRDNYLFDHKNSFRVSDSLSACPGNGKGRIYKQGILVYEDEYDCNLNFNISFGQLDERRVLLELHSIITGIQWRILQSSEKEALAKIIGSGIGSDKECILNRFDSHYHGGGTFREAYIEACVTEGHKLSSYRFMEDAISKDKTLELPGKKLSTIGDHMWAADNTVTVLSYPSTPKESIPVGHPVMGKLALDFNGINVLETELSGDVVVADKYCGSILVDKSFDPDNDAHLGKFLVQYLMYRDSRNIVESLSNELVKFLKK